MTVMDEIIVYVVGPTLGSLASLPVLPILKRLLFKKFGTKAKATVEEVKKEATEMRFVINDDSSEEEEDDATFEELLAQETAKSQAQNKNHEHLL